MQSEINDEEMSFRMNKLSVMKSEIQSDSFNSSALLPSPVRKVVENFQKDNFEVEDVDEPEEPFDYGTNDLEKILEGFPPNFESNQEEHKDEGMTMQFESKEISESELSEVDQLSIGDELGTVDRRNLE